MVAERKTGPRGGDGRGSKSGPGLTGGGSPRSMLSLSAFLTTLPPASLAATDLCRFATRALNRRTREELPDLLALLEQHSLSGYAETLAPALAGIVDRLIAEEVDPAELDPDGLERRMMTRPWLEAVGARTKLVPQHLRPGVPVSTAVRAVTRQALHILPGVGPQLMLVAPVEAVRVAGLGWSCLRGPAYARPMDAEEADHIKAAWAAIEESFGWKTPESEPWEGRFLRLIMKANLPAQPAMQALQRLGEDARRATWSALIEHARDQELAEGHRPGKKGLVRRLSDVGVEIPAPGLAALADVMSLTYEGCAPDPDVERGVCPCSHEDLATYATWVDVALASRQRLEAMPPELVEHHLRTMAEIDAGALDVDFDDTLRRDLRHFRDAYLKRRYRRRVEPLFGVEPLALTRHLVAQGSDRKRMMEAVQLLADEARRVRKEAGESPPAAAEPEATPAPAPEPEVAPVPALGLPRNNPFKGFAAQPPRQHSKTVTDTGLKNPFAELNVPSGDLPPMPRPPKQRRRITTRPIQLPPMPEVGKAPPRKRLPTGPIRTTRPASEPKVAAKPAEPRATEPKAAPRVPEVLAPLPKADEPPAPLGSKPTKRLAPKVAPRKAKPSRLSSAAHLVTPAQANAFYEEAFRELQILERDLLERGPWQDAAERLHHLQREAQRLADSLGPSARSGDQAFKSALRRVEIVVSYLARIMPLLDGPPEPDLDRLPDDTPESEGSVLKKLGRLFKKGED